MNTFAVSTFLFFDVSDRIVAMWTELTARSGRDSAKAGVHNR